MTWDGTTIAALIALIIVSVLLFAVLQQALGERGRAGVGRIVDGIAAVIITMRGTREKKEEADVSDRAA